MRCEGVGGGWYEHLGLGLWCVLCQGLPTNFVFIEASCCSTGAVVREELSLQTFARADS